MDNEKKPEYLKNLLEKEGPKAANEDPAKDQKKNLAPIKDETTARPEDPSKSERIDRARKEGGAFGRGIGGDSTKAPDGEYKSPRHKIIDKGEQKAGGVMESQTKNNKENEARSKKREKRMSIPKKEFDKAAWEKVQAEKQKAVQDKAQQLQKQQPQQVQHKPSFLQQKAQEQLRVWKTQESKAEVAKTEVTQKQVVQKSVLQQKSQQVKSASPPKRVTVKAPPTKGRGK